MQDPLNAPWRVAITREPLAVHLVVPGGSTPMDTENIDKVCTALTVAGQMLEHETPRTHDGRPTVTVLMQVEPEGNLPLRVYTDAAAAQAAASAYNERHHVGEWDTAWQYTEQVPVDTERPAGPVLDGPVTVDKAHARRPEWDWFDVTQREACAVYYAHEDAEPGQVVRIDAVVSQRPGGDWAWRVYVTVRRPEGDCRARLGSDAPCAKEKDARGYATRAVNAFLRYPSTGGLTPAPADPARPVRTRQGPGVVVVGNTVGGDLTITTEPGRGRS